MAANDVIVDQKLLLRIFWNIFLVSKFLKFGEYSSRMANLGNCPQPTNQIYAQTVYRENNSHGGPWPQIRTTCEHCLFMINPNSSFVIWYSVNITIAVKYKFTELDSLFFTVKYCQHSSSPTENMIKGCHTCICNISMSRYNKKHHSFSLVATIL